VAGGAPSRPQCDRNGLLETQASPARRLRPTFDDLQTAIGDICDLFDPQECWNFFKAAGYASNSTHDALTLLWQIDLALV
jgi:hypothetical protein